MNIFTLALASLIIFYCVSSTALCVKSSRANLRSGPSTKYSKTWEVYEYMPFRKIKRKGRWVRVKDVDGDYHWIHSKLVTSRFKCAVVKVKKANLRTGPGTKYKKQAYVSSVEKYASFKLIKVKGNWVKVKDSYGDSSWIYRKLLWVQ